MAGAGYKLFNSGDVLTAAQVNTYLMEQTVMVFNDAAARTTALSGVVSEGMISYLKDTNAVEVYNGSAWVASDDPNAIQNTIVDAKGDLITATAADTPARLASSGVNGDVLTVDTSTATGLKWAAAAASSPLTTKGDLYSYSTTNARLGVGANGETLVADSSTTTGLRWQANQAAGRNFLTNGSFDIWQRGTSFTGGSASTYSADRWIAFRAVAGSTFSRQTTSDTTNLPFIQYAMRVQRNSGNTATNTIQLVQPLESVNSIPLVGQTVVFSFWARRGANFSAASNNLNVLVQTGTGTDQNNATGFTGSVSIVDTTQALTTTWTRYSFSATVATTATQVGVQLYYSPVGTAGADDWFEATGLQLELGTVPTRFTRQGGTLAGEFAAACRYFYRALNGADSTNERFGGGQCVSTTAADIPFRMPVEMRVAPTLTISSASHFNLLQAGGSIGGATTGITIFDATRRTANLAASGSSSLVAGNFTQLRSNSASATIDFSAEL